MSAEAPTCPECGNDDQYDIEVLYSTDEQFAAGSSPWDEAGTNHRSARSSTSVNYYRCSNGHRWSEEV